MSKKSVDTFGEALSVLVQVAHIAQSKGVLSLDDAALVHQALHRVDEFKAAAEAHATNKAQEDVKEGARG